MIHLTTGKLKASDKNNPPDFPYTFKWREKKWLYNTFWRIDDFTYCNKSQSVPKMYSITEHKELNRFSAIRRTERFVKYQVHVCRANTSQTLYIERDIVQLALFLTKCIYCSKDFIEHTEMMFGTWCHAVEYKGKDSAVTNTATLCLEVVKIFFSGLSCSPVQFKGLLYLTIVHVVSYSLLYLSIVHVVWVVDHKGVMDLWTNYNADFADDIAWLSSVYQW